MYQGDSVDISYLNPLMFYHNLYMRGNSNSIVGLDVNAAITKRLHAYSQLIIDEIAAPGESADDIPSALGLITGLTYVHPLAAEKILSIQCETVYTDPYLYLRDGDSDSYPIDFIVANRQFIRGDCTAVDEDFLGFSLGPDVLAFALRAQIFSVDSWNFGTSLTYLLKGCIDQDSTWARGSGPASLVAPTSSDPENPDKDAVEQRLTANLQAKIPLTSGFMLSSNIDWIHRWHAENSSANGYSSDLQTTLGITVQL